MTVVRILRWALVLLLVTVFACWPQLAGPNRSGIEVTPIPIPMTVLPLLSPTVYVFATATPTAQAAEKLPTRASTNTPTPTFTPLPTLTATPEVTRVPIQRG